MSCFCHILEENLSDEYETNVDDRTKNHRKGKEICQGQKPQPVRYHRKLFEDANGQETWKNKEI